MSDYIKYMYREYLEGRTHIKKVNEDQPLFPNTGAGLLIQKNKLTDEWRDGMVEQVSGFMDKIKDMDAEKSEGADTVLAETFNSIDALSTDAAIDLLRVYSNCDASGRDAVAKTFYALSGESFDSYLMTASEVCKKTLGMLEPEPPQPAKTKNLSQKTMSSREASNRLSDEIGVKPCTRDEGTVGDS